MVVQRCITAFVTQCVVFLLLAYTKHGFQMPFGGLGDVCDVASIELVGPAFGFYEPACAAIDL